MWIFGREAVNGHAAQTFGETFDQTEMELADYAGLPSGNFLKWTPTQYKVDLATPLAPGRTEATSH
jgi:hypothetical protein